MQNRRIKTLLVCLIMAIALLVIPAETFAASSSITVSADKTEAKPGDTINYSVILGPVEDMGTMQMMLVIPEGLSFVSGSGKLADGLKSTLGYDTVDFVERTKIINGYGSGDDYCSEDNTLICTFQCKVEDGFSGTAEIGLTELEFYSCQTWEDHTENYTVSNAIVRITADETTSGEEPSSSGNTTPDEPTPSNDTPTGDPTPSGSTTPDEPTPSGDTTPDEPTPSNDTPTGDPTPSGSTTPDEPTPSGDTTPDEPTPSGDTTPDEPTPSGDTTPDEPVPSGGNDLTPSGEGGDNASDPDQSIPDNYKAPDNEKNSSEDPNHGPQSSFQRWVIAVVALLVLMFLILVLKKRKETAKKHSIYRK